MDSDELECERACQARSLKEKSSERTKQSARDMHEQLTGPSRLKQHMKQFIQKLLRPFGYQLQDLRKLGRDPWRDLEILLHATPSPLCFDIGAHRGETSSFIIGHFPGATIYAFEPEPQNFEVLQNAVKAIPRIEIFQMAMGDRLGKAKFLRTQYSQTHSLLPAASSLKSEAHRKVDEVEVVVSTVDDFCQERGITSIDLLKTDCQGFDLRVLKGAGKMLAERRVKFLICECLYAAEYEGQGWFYELLQFLTEMNYAPVTFCNPTRNKFNEATGGDVIFKRKELIEP
jgi:FkbM family methyltransferase